MKSRILPVLVGVVALFWGCTKEPSKDDPKLVHSSINSRAKTVLVEKLGAYQGKAEGLYALSNGLLRVGKHSVDVTPVVEFEGTRDGQNIVAMRVEVVIDGVKRPEVTFGVVGVAVSQDEAIATGLGDWYLSLAEPLFQALGEKKAPLAIAEWSVFAGTLGIRGSTALGWVDGSEAMKRKVLNTVLPVLSGRPELVTVDLKVMVPSSGQPQGECRIGGVVSAELASRLFALDWPRTSEGYFFKQAFVLKRATPG